MASAHAHPTPHTITVEYSRRDPSLSTLTHPQLLLPNLNTVSSTSPVKGSSFSVSDTELSPSSSNGVHSPLSTDSFELGTAKTFLMPLRPKPTLPLSNLQTYGGYEHGAPLSDIGEEDTTPRSRRTRSRTPSPFTSSPSTAPQSSGWKGQDSQKRLSEISNSSGISTGSDLQWEGFDTRAGISDRLRADLAAAVDDGDDFATQMDTVASSGDDENTTQALSKRAEQILANAKKRLTNMEGNLSKARTSLLITPRASPTFGEFKQAGGLYRSISQGGDRIFSQNSRKSRPVHSPANGANAVHARNISETSVPSGSAKKSKYPEVRSASAMEYGHGGRSIDALLEERSRSSLANGQSPTSNRSQTSPLTVLREEEGSASTDLTSSESSGNTGLGIRNDRFQSRNVTNGYGNGLTRSQSQMSTREVRDQLNGLKNKIADIRTGQRADKNRRNSLQSLRTPNSFTEPEEWYASAAEYKGGISPLSTNAGMGSRYEKDVEDAPRKPSTPPRSPRMSRSPKSPVSPSFAKPAVIHEPGSNVVPTAIFGQDLHSYSSTPNPASTLKAIDRDGDDRNSFIQDSHYEDAFEERSDEIDISVAASEEEQIYLNEVLEESLQDAGQDVPSAPGGFQAAEPERHEDRADAFDYENFFLHSALGNYSQAGFHRRNVSRATADSRMSYESNDSVETTRAPPTEETGAKPELEREEEDVLQRERLDGGTFLEEEAPTLTGPEAPFAQHFRSNSTDSVSSNATFATATEGDDDSRTESDTVPSEILHWGERPLSSMVGAWPTPPASSAMGVVYLTNDQRSPFSTPVPSAGNLTPNSGGLPPTPPVSSPLQQQQQEEDLPGGEEGISDSASHQHPANTEILISALITLANPDFKSTGAFSDIDKDLVVSVLRSVGTVCEGIHASDSRGDVYESRVWRRRLDLATRILAGEIEVEDE